MTCAWSGVRSVGNPPDEREHLPAQLLLKSQEVGFGLHSGETGPAGVVLGPGPVELVPQQGRDPRADGSGVEHGQHLGSRAFLRVPERAHRARGKSGYDYGTLHRVSSRSGP